MHLSENVSLRALGVKFEADETVQEVTLLRGRVGDCLVPFLSIARHPSLPERKSMSLQHALYMLAYFIHMSLAYFIHMLNLCTNCTKY